MYIHNGRKLRLVLSILLCLLFLAQPFALAANEPSAPLDEPTEQVAEQDVEQEPLAVDDYDAIRTEQNELTELRTANSKTYSLGGDARQLVLYADDVHYMDKDDIFREIDNEIVENTSRIGDRDYGYKNAANSYTARFSPDAAQDLVHLEYDEKSMTITPVFSQPDDGTITLSDEPQDEPEQTLPSDEEAQPEEDAHPEQPEAQAQPEEEAQPEQTEDEIQPEEQTAITPEAPGAQLMTEQPFESEALSGLIIPQNSIRYENIAPNIDLIYETRNHELKEYIVLKQPTDINEFYFDYTLKGLIPDATDGLRFLDESGEEVFSTPALFAIDAAGAVTENVSIELISYEDDVARIKVTLDPAYLNNMARSFPIVVDPTERITDDKNTFDTYVSSTNRTTNYYLSKYLKTGKSTSGEAFRSYIKFNMEGLDISAAQVNSAYVRLKFISGDTPSTLYARRLVREWNSQTLTWDNTSNPALTTSETGAANISAVGKIEGNNWYVMQVNAMVKNILNGSATNYGWRIKDKTTEANNKVSTFCSSDYGYPYRPELEINYTTSSTTGSNAVLCGVKCKNTSGGYIATNTNFDVVAGYLSNHGYSTSSLYKSFTESQIKTYMNSNSNCIFVLIGHGGYVDSSISGSTPYTFTLVSTDGSESIQSNTSFSSLNLSNQKIMIFLSCRSGQNTEGSYNMPTSAVNKGAKTAIGFKGTIDVPSTSSWLKFFFTEMNKGKTVASTFTTLMDSSSIYRDAIVGTGLENYQVCGSTNTKL